jgi:hypothetical protein
VGVSLRRLGAQKRPLSSAAQFNTGVSAVLAFGWGWLSRMRWPSRVISMLGGKSLARYAAVIGN